MRPGDNPLKQLRVKIASVFTRELKASNDSLVNFL